MILCCVCDFMPEDERPVDWENSPILIINGNSLCVEHAHWGGFNEPYAKWLKVNK